MEKAKFNALWTESVINNLQIPDATPSQLMGNSGHGDSGPSQTPAIVFRTWPLKGDPQVGFQTAINAMVKSGMYVSNASCVAPLSVGGFKQVQSWLVDVMITVDPSNTLQIYEDTPGGSRPQPTPMTAPLQIFAGPCSQSFMAVARPNG